MFGIFRIMNVPRWREIMLLLCFLYDIFRLCLYLCVLLIIQTKDFKMQCFRAYVLRSSNQKMPNIYVSKEELMTFLKKTRRQLFYQLFRRKLF
jgi:hypothetical protein